ncbi:MAG: hypothetical protein C5B50_08515 [Verrucomicrobia bacterium]|nr:MAG: hypothetical protein C5B50_08515 [Verrucomicrobiota bacterium]
MGRSLRILVAAVAVVAAVAALSYFCAMRLCCGHMTGDDLTWLKREFQLSNQEMQRIRVLHEGYLPKCREFCAKIAAKQDAVEKALAAGEVPEQQMIELATLRTQCQAQMLRHFKAVASEMPHDQGSRYLAEMQRLTLGFHQNIESSMRENPASGHAHGDH